MRTELQGTEKWHADRSGRVTASRFKDVMAWGKPDKSGKREPMGARTSYMRELCFERLAKNSTEAGESSLGRLVREITGRNACHSSKYLLISKQEITKRVYRRIGASAKPSK